MLPIRNLCLTSLLLLAGASGAREAIVVSWGSHDAPPYAIVESEQLSGGIIHDLGREMSTREKWPVEFLQVPRGRYEPMLSSGQVDVTCILNPDWLANPQAYLWSPPLFEESDVLVQDARAGAPKSLAEFSGKRIGTIRDYRYPRIDPLFSAGTMIRDDAASLDSNLQRLVIGRLDAVIDADLPIRWWLRTHGAQHRLLVADLNISRHNVHCAISRKSPVEPAVINRALETMVNDGTVRRIVTRYLENASP